MNTPAHVVVSLALLGRVDQRRRNWAVLWGSLIPDMPIFAFYLWQKLGMSTTWSHIWGTLYFEPQWQNFFDVFNSIPLALIGWVIFRMRKSAVGTAFCISALLHMLFDLPLHHDDAHRHFYPFSDWRFVSPISYWDPEHGGRFGALFEAGVIAIAAWTLWWKFPRRGVRLGLGLLCVAGLMMHWG